MKAFKDWSIKYKILAVTFAIGIIFCILGVYYIYATLAIKNSSRQIELRNFTAIELVTSLQLSLYEMDDPLHFPGALQPKQAITETHQKLEISTRKIRQLLSEIKDLVKNEPDALNRALNIENVFEQYANPLNERLKELPREETLSEHAREKALYEQLSLEISDMRNEEISRLSWALGRIDRLTDDIRNSYFVLLLLTSIIAFLLSCFIAKIIARPLKNLLLSMRKLANGSFNGKLAVITKDEIGSLQRGFLGMEARLKQASDDLQKERDGLEIKVGERTKELQQSQLYLKQITDGVEEGIMLLDTDYKILWANVVILKLCDMELKGIIGRHCYEVTHKLNAPPPANLCPMDEVLKTKQPTAITHKHIDSEGNNFYEEIMVYPLLDEAGNVKQLIHVNRDITDKVAHEERLMGYVKKLEAAQSELQVRVDEMSRFTRIAVDRELKMVELKEKINKLEEELNKYKPSP